MNPVLAAPSKSPLAAAAGELGIEVRDLSGRGDLDLKAARRLRTVASGFEGLHLHSARAHGLAALAFLGRQRPKVLVSRRVDFPLKPGWGTRFKYHRGVEAYLPVSECIGSILAAGGISTEKIHVVYSGVDPSRMEVPREAESLRLELGAPGDSFLVGFLGALVHHKAPDVLLRAMPRLDKRIHLVFAGDGPMRRDLQRTAGPWQRRVHFLGFRSDIPRLMRSIDVFVLPSRTEGLGTSVLDAMAAGTPVVGSTGGGIPEMIEHEVSGLLVPPERSPELAEAVNRLAGAPDLRQKLAQGGRSRVVRFTEARMVDRTLEVYKLFGLV